MDKTKGCIRRILNTDDNMTMTIAAQFLADETITVTIFSEGKVPLYGQTSIEQQLREYPRLGVSRERALLDMRNELFNEGQGGGARFVLRGTKFLWKTKAWWKGGLDTRPIEDIATLASITTRLLNECVCTLGNEKVENHEEEDFALLKKKNTELMDKLRAAEEAKKRMEDTLYSKFLLLLNEKKKFIRQLEGELNSRKGANGGDYLTQDDPYHGETDDETMSEEIPPTPPDLVIRSTRRNATASTNKEPKSERSCSPESEQDEIVLKYEETPPDIEVAPSNEKHDSELNSNS